VLLCFVLPVAAVGNFPADDEPASTKTPLMSAAREGDAAAVARLISAGADVNAANAGGATALMFAALSGDPKVTSLLVRAGARTETKAKLGWTALALAAASKARAVMAERPNASFEDVKHVAPAVLRHRIILDYNARIEGLTTDDAIRSLLEEIPFQANPTPATLAEA